MADERLGTIRIETTADEKQVAKAFKEGGESAGRAAGSQFSDQIREKIVSVARRFGGSSGGSLAAGAMGRFSSSPAALPSNQRNSPVASAAATGTGVAAGRAITGGAAAGGAAARGGALAAAGSGGAAGALSVAGFAAIPIIQLVAFGIALKKGADIAGRWNDQLDRSAERFAGINAGFAGVSAMNQIRQLRRDMVASNALFPAFQYTNAFRQNLKDQTLGFEVRRQRVGAALNLLGETVGKIDDALLDRFAIRHVDSFLTSPKGVAIFNGVLFGIKSLLGIVANDTSKIREQMNMFGYDKTAENVNRQMTKEILALVGEPFPGDDAPPGPSGYPPGGAP